MYSGIIKIGNSFTIPEVLLKHMFQKSFRNAWNVHHYCSQASEISSNKTWVVVQGRKPGFYFTWEECQEQVKNYRNAKFRRFNSNREALNYFKLALDQYSQIHPKDKEYYENLKTIFIQYDEKWKHSAEESAKPKRKYDPVFSELVTVFRDLSANPYNFEDDSGNSEGSLEKNIPVEKKEIAPSLTTFKNDKPLKAAKAMYVYNKSCKDVASNSEIGERVVNGYLQVYTDGSCFLNGEDNSYGSVGVYFGPESKLNTSLSLEGKVTNNIAEVKAAILGLKIARENGFTKVKLFTDSNYVVKACTLWMKKWKQDKWRKANGKPVLNQDLLKKLDEEISKLDDVKLIHVRGHKGIKGNEQADKLARNCHPTP